MISKKVGRVQCQELRKHFLLHPIRLRIVLTFSPMKIVCFASLLFWTKVVAADYHPPSKDDHRSPCPAINILANHGIISRDGVDIDTEELVEALAEFFPVSADFPRMPLEGAKEQGLVDEQDDGSMTLTLSRLLEAHVAEHDASFTRVDSYFGLELAAHVDNDLVDSLLASNDLPYLSLDDVLKFQYARVQHSLTNNPKASFSAEDQVAMAQQATRIMAFGQQPGYDKVDKGILLSMLKYEAFPSGYQVDPAFEKVSFEEGSTSAYIRDMFIENIEAAISDFDPCNGNSLCIFFRMLAKMMA